MSLTSWRPDWWKDEIHGNSWERIKDALRRDWEQTRKDLHLGGHEYNQSIANTLRQVAGSEAVPPGDGPNAPHVIEDWGDVELPLGYGHGARLQHGQRYASWSADLESVLREEWERARPAGSRPWEEVKRHVQKGYDTLG